MILGGGPNRIGQGIEFDYCCVHASFALKDLGYETIMVNSNPETVSTDYDTSSRLYFEPLTLEDVLNIVAAEKPDGVIVQFGGQTPLNLAVPLARHKVPIIGTSPDSIDRAEDRKRFTAVLNKLGLHQPPNATANSADEAIQKARELGFPVLVRPSYVLGGRAMRITYDEDTLQQFIHEAIKVNPDHPILVDKFLEEAIEVDVDAVADSEQCIIAGIMEHIEEAGIHSGDSACVIPPYSLPDHIQQTILYNTRALARELNVIGLMNIQFAVKDDKVYILEVNPRASRTVPFVSKATGIPWAKIAAQVMVGKKLSELGISGEVPINHYAVKEAVFPFNRFPGVDPILGPEMKSTGEVMGIDEEFGRAFIKSQLAASQRLPKEGTILISVNDKDKKTIVGIARQMAVLGFKLAGTRGTALYLKENGIEAETALKLGEGRPNILDLIKNGSINLVINTPSGRDSAHDQITIRRSAIQYSVPYITTMPGAAAAVHGIESLQKGEITVKTIQEYHQINKL
jgi:carbamoyl-phosphate synthase large subunit